jgi:hypothetical protein
MNAPNRIESRELARRANGGIDVRLLWQPRTDRVFVDVVDGVGDDAFRIIVAAADALDAFNHPYAYRRELVTCEDERKGG